MEYLEKYDELLVLIDIFEEMKNNYKVMEYNLRQQCSNGSGEIGSIDYSGMPKGHKVNPEADVTLNKLFALRPFIDNTNESLEILYESKNKIETYIASLEGTEHKVAYLKFIKNKDIKFISTSLGISEGTVKNILTRIKKKK